jgi:hypothetical protein
LQALSFALSLGLTTGCDNALLLADGPGPADGSGEASLQTGDATQADSREDGHAGEGDATTEDVATSDAVADSGADADSGASDAEPSDDASAPDGGPLLGEGGPPSCVGLAINCGPAHDESCCASSVVTGGMFDRNNNASFPATVSDFQLDRFEVTVGRFRKFWQQYPANMPAGSSGIDSNNPRTLAGTRSGAGRATFLRARARSIRRCSAPSPPGRTGP